MISEAIECYKLANEARKKGEDPYPFLVQAAIAALNEGGNSMIELEATIIAISDCSCEIYNGRTQSIREALDSLFVPVKSCPKGYCSACYAFRGKRDGGGRLIRKIT